MNDFSDWEKEMQAKMNLAVAKGETDMNVPAGSTMEQFHNWQAEIERKMESL